jgi:hypothetical protein
MDSTPDADDACERHKLLLDVFRGALFEVASDHAEKVWGGKRFYVWSVVVTDFGWGWALAHLVPVSAAWMVMCAPQASWAVVWITSAAVVWQVGHLMATYIEWLDRL